MAKGKERPTTTTRNASLKSAGSRPAEARTEKKAAPEAPATPRVEGRETGNTAARLSPEQVYRLIQESAYFKAKARGFAPGHEVQDWIEAEAEVRRRLEERA